MKNRSEWLIVSTIKLTEQISAISILKGKAKQPLDFPTCMRLGENNTYCLCTGRSICFDQTLLLYNRWNYHPYTGYGRNVKSCHVLDRTPCRQFCWVRISALPSLVVCKLYAKECITVDIIDIIRSIYGKWHFVLFHNKMPVKHPLSQIPWCYLLYSTVCICG